MKTKVTIELPEWMVKRITNPRDETDTRMAAMWLLGAVLVELEPLEVE